MKTLLYIYIVVLGLSTAYGQQLELKKANKLFDEYAFPQAAEAYEDYLKKGGKPGEATLKKIADAYYYAGEYSSAVQWYGQLNKPGYLMDDVYFKRYIQSLLMDGNVRKNYRDLADNLIKERLSANKDKLLLAKYSEQKKYLDSINSVDSSYEVNDLKVNSDKADFGTAFYGDQIVYSSSKDVGKAGRKIYKWNEQPMLELYVGDRDTATGELLNEQKFFPDKMNNYHTASLTFTNDLKTVYFSTNNVKQSGFLNNAENGTNNLQIIKADINKGKLENEVILKINKITYSVAHPALTADGKWMFFISDMPGGYGETDLYVAKVLENGELDKFENLGPEINTAGKEMFPFVNGAALYFSSDGRYGMGGLDVFQSRILEDMKFSQPQNLGAPVNSNRDDFTFIIDKNETYGYFSSNRQKGSGDDDIYFFRKKSTDCKQLIAGRIINTQAPVKDAEIKVYDEQGALVATAQTGSDGYYAIPVACNRKYTVEAAKPEHGSIRQEVVVENVKVQVPDVNLDALENLTRNEGGELLINIAPIYFDLDKYEITAKAKTELDKVVKVMMKFPQVRIKIESHTDSRQTNNYNIRLSHNRAKATYDYLLINGISPERIDSFKGYGETRLKNKCSDGVVCSEEEHQLNRRSDFIIVSK